METPVVEALREDAVSLGERLVDVAALVLDVREVVRLGAVVQERRVGSERLLGVGDGRQGLVLDLDQARGVLRDVAGRRDDAGNRLADEANLLGRQHRPVVGHDLLSRQAGGDRRDVRYVFRGQHERDSLVGAGRRRVDLRHLRVGVRAAQEGRVQHPRQVDVVHVLATAAQVPGVLEPGDALADVLLRSCGLGRRHHAPPPSVRPASWTAATMPT